MALACESWQIRLWGRVTAIDWVNLTFAIDDGAGVPVTVYAPQVYGISIGDYVAVTGTLNASSRTLICSPSGIQWLAVSN